MINFCAEGGRVDFTVRYQLDQGEAVRAFQLGVRRQLAVVYRVLPAVLIVGGLVLVAIEDLAIGVGMLVAAVVAPFAATWAVRRMVGRQLRYMCLPATLRMAADGYEVRTDQYTTQMQWSMFTQVVNTEDFWLLFGNRQFLAFLPKSAFNTEQQAALADLFHRRYA